jgi:hypothetical protein
MPPLAGGIFYQQKNVFGGSVVGAQHAKVLIICQAALPTYERYAPPLTCMV